MTEIDDRRLVFRRNFERALRRSGLKVAELARRAQIPAHVLRRWLRQGAVQPRHDFLQAAGRVLGLAEPRRLLFSLPEPALLDRATNPAVDEVIRDHPDLVAHLDEEDLAELYSLHGTGGPLTYEGALAAARHIDQKRALRRQFEVLLETHHFHTLRLFIEALYRDTTPRSAPE